MIDVICKMNTYEKYNGLNFDRKLIVTSAGFDSDLVCLEYEGTKVNYHDLTLRV